MNKEQAQKMMENASYLKGKEVEVKRRNRKVVTCTVQSFGASSHRPNNSHPNIEVWANLIVNGSGEKLTVKLRDLYSKYPPKKFIKIISKKTVESVSAGSNGSHVLPEAETSH